MATEADRPALASAGSADGSETAAGALDGGIDLDVVELELRKLLRGYRFALRYASDMPSVGRSAVSHGRPRWGSRFWTRVYVETHVRKQLLAIGDCLRLLDTTDAEETARLKALGEELEAHSAPLFRWRRLTGLVSRLPPVAAAIPALSAASAWPLAGDVTGETLRDAFLLLVATAFLLWIVVVWPSVRFGFRVKRVIFAGGVEIRRTRRSPSTEVTWKGFTVPRYSEDGRIADATVEEFRTENVYWAENRVYRTLNRRKPAEAPLDLLLSFTPYVWTAYSIFYFWGFVNAIATRGLDGVSWVGLVFAGVFALVPFIYPSEARRIYRMRPH